MPRIGLASMSIEALLELRDDVGRVLTGKVSELRRQLAALGEDVDGVRPRGRRVSMKGRKVPPKYRGPDGETWAGRGARPRWLVALLKQGRKIEEFAVDKAATASKLGFVKRRRKK